MLELLLLLIAAHALCDYPFQGDFLANGKNHKNPIPGVPFYHPLLAHSSIHGAAVGLITGNIWLGVAEFLIHTAIDYSKCDGRIGFNTDQVMHIICKFVWVAFIFAKL